MIYKSLFFLVILMISLTQVSALQSWTFDTTADFSMPGTSLFNVEALNNILSLKSDMKSLNYLWVANADESSVSKIDTNTGKEVARYWTGSHPATSGEYPSRTSVDGNGNVWVGNRLGDQTVIKIAAQLKDCHDKDGDGIETSYDANNDGVITFDLVNPERSEILPSGKDECVILSVNHWPGLTDVGPRAVAIDTDGKVWVGIWQTGVYYVLNPDTGALITKTAALGPSYGAAMGKKLMWINVATGTNVGVYGLRIKDEGNGKPIGSIVESYLGSSFKPPIPSTVAAPAFYVIAPDKNDNVWVANWVSGNLNKLSHGLITNYIIESPSGTGSTRGVTVDKDGYIWTTSWNSGKIYKVNPSNGAIVCFYSTGWLAPSLAGVTQDNAGFIWAIGTSTSNSVIKLKSNCGFVGVYPVGRSPYTYSDATGQLFYQFINSGTWDVTLKNTLNSNNIWNTISWSEVNKVGDTVKVELKSSADSSFTRVQNGVPFTKTSSDLITRVTIFRNLDGSSPNVDKLSIFANCVGSEASEITCNNVDDDCDGIIDESLTQLSGDLGACSINTQNCSAGNWINNNEITPIAETCNNIDDDCDGVVDEGLTQLSGDLGVCSTNTQNCSAGNWIDNHEIVPVEEICVDHLDNDCDGLTDWDDTDVCFKRPGNLTGFVYDRDTNQPIPYAFLRLYWLGNKLETTTKNDGSYLFEFIGDRDYFGLYASAEYHESEHVENIRVPIEKEVKQDFKLGPLISVNCVGCANKDTNKCDTRCSTNPACLTGDYNANCEGSYSGDIILDDAGYMTKCCDQGSFIVHTNPFSLNSNTDNLVRTERIVNINGKPHKLVVITYSK